MATVICPHCGVNNRSGSNFCNNCGTALGESDLRPPESEAKRASDLSQPAKPTTGSTPAEPEVAETHEADTPPPTQHSSDPDECTQNVPHTVEQPEREPTERKQTERALPPVTPQETSTQKEDPPAETFTRSAVARGIPGLLEPQTIVGQTIEEVPRTATTDSSVEDVDLRRIRTLMTSDPRPNDERGTSDKIASPALRIPWVFALFGLALAIPIFFRFSGPAGAVYELPGVANAFAVIDQMETPGVLLLWAYDPATAGELDLAVEPVLRHLEAKENNILLTSTLPFGPATARSVLNNIAGESPQSTESNVEIPVGYLPGGAAVLPLLAQAREMAISPDQMQPPSALLKRDLDLVLVVSAQAEEVQYWLEQGQTLNQIKTIAVTSAGADPYLRPYLDSGQLSGLVSGFDGGISYQRLLNRAASTESSAATDTLLESQFRQQVYQNWGHFAILALIMLGNFSMLNNRNARGQATASSQTSNRSATGERTSV